MSDTELLDIGHGMKAALRLAEGLKEHFGIEDGTVVGVLLMHPCSKREVQQTSPDFIPVNPYPFPPEVWKLESQDPLTISPSVNFTCCGCHGFVQQGKWVPA